MEEGNGIGSSDQSHIQNQESVQDYVEADTTANEEFHHASRINEEESDSEEEKKKVNLDSSGEWEQSQRSQKQFKLDGTLFCGKDRILATITNDKALAWTVVNQGPQSTSKQNWIKEATTLIPFADILGVEFHPKVSKAFVLYCFPKGRTHRTRKYHILYARDHTHARTWVLAIRSVLRGVSPGVSPPPIRLTIMLNPIGGSGKAKSIWKSIKDMFEIADITVTLLETTHEFHCLEYVQTMDITACEGIVCISGDGLLYEVLNGLMMREDRDQAMKIPLGIIPSGSGNAVATTIGSTDPLHAAFYIIKGGTTPIDILQIEHGENYQEKKYALLSVCWGVLADVDKDSEKHRWMGGFRFTYTGASKALNPKGYSGKIGYVPVNNSQEPCQLTECKVCKTAQQLLQDGQLVEAEKETVWLEDKFFLFFVSNLPMISGDVRIAPYAHLTDGYMDLLVTKKMGTTKAAKLLLSLDEAGSVASLKDVQYHKVKSVVLEPKNMDDIIMIDGEKLQQTSKIRITMKPCMATLFIAKTVNQKGK